MILQGNVAIGGSQGFGVSGALAQVRGNLAIATEVGFHQHAKATVTGNAALVGGIGFLYEAGQQGQAVTSSNVSVGNAKAGFVIESGTPVYASAQKYMLNSAIGNVGRGLLVQVPVDISYSNITATASRSRPHRFRAIAAADPRHQQQHRWPCKLLGGSTGPARTLRQSLRRRSVVLQTDPSAQSPISIKGPNLW